MLLRAIDYARTSLVYRKNVDFSYVYMWRARRSPDDLFGNILSRHLELNQEISKLPYLIGASLLTWFKPLIHAFCCCCISTVADNRKL